MPRMVAIGLMWASPVLLTLVALVLSQLAGGHGARTAVIKAEVRVALAVFVLVHAGFYLGPWLLSSGHRVLGLCLTAPVALVASFLVTATMSRFHLFDRSSVPTPLVFKVLPMAMAVSYWGPVAALAWGR